MGACWRLNPMCRAQRILTVRATTARAVITTKEARRRTRLPLQCLVLGFFDRHRAKLADNFRLAMVYRNLDKMDDLALNALRAQANKTRSQLESL